jgi:alkaline phosphatase D
MKKLFLFCFLIPVIQKSVAQHPQLKSGPWAGNIELRNAVIWAEVSPSVKSVSIRYQSAFNKIQKTISYKGELGKEFNPVKIELNGLQINSEYTYSILLDNKPVDLPFKTVFKTKDLWQYRKPAPDFNFLAGSCSYFNEPLHDRPGVPYGRDSSIFETMANTPALFNLWLGDSWYTREVDYYSAWGLENRISVDRSKKVLQKFMAVMPQYFIWDDHDYGPNNSGKEFFLKEESRNIFKEYTLNPSYGEDGKGIYSKLSFSDVDFFLTDDRYFRSDTRLMDSTGGKSNSSKTYFGKVQMEWLKNSLLFSNATFKVIASGSQVLNPVSTVECMRFYSYEYNELMEFLSAHKINGVIFLTGDRHHSEVIKKERAGSYPLYDVTVSPLTASVAKVRGAEINNPYRINNTLVESQNFGNIVVSGPKDQRMFKIIFTGIKGEKLAEWSVNEAELKVKKEN